MGTAGCDGGHGDGGDGASAGGKRERVKRAEDSIEPQRVWTDEAQPSRPSGIQSRKFFVVSPE